MPEDKKIPKSKTPKQKEMLNLADRIVDFAVTRFGKKVFDGKCWDLPFEALAASGAKTPRG
jgi:hypothetical protein